MRRSSQDSHDDWLAESSQMCKIYQEAQVTIAAAHAQNGFVGCFYRRDGISCVPFEVPISITSGMMKEPSHMMFDPYPEHRYAGKDEPLLYSRAWVFQEQVLSPRMLIFDGAAIRWECFTKHASDAEPSGGIALQRGAMKRIRLRLNDKSSGFFQTDPAQDAEDWRSAVMEYTHRGMTKFSDRLIAISGIAQAIQARTSNVYLAGLWQDQIIFDLLWCVPFNREYASETKYSTPESSRENPPVAPTWSWASTNLPVYYTSLQKLEPVCETLDVAVNGSTSSMTGHIRIRGHTRKMYIRSIYPTSFAKIAASTRDFVVEPLEWVAYGTLDFHPFHYFLASPTKPMILCPKNTFKLFPGTWRPDEILDPLEPITFIAIAERPRYTRGRGFGTTADPHEVFTLGLLPVDGLKDVYRRVGYAEWDYCSWYGYDCGPGDLSTSKSFLTRLEHKMALIVHTLTLWFTRWRLSVYRIPLVTTRRLPNGLVFVRKFRCSWLWPGQGRHQHPPDREHPFPSVDSYHESVKVQCKTITIT